MHELAPSIRTTRGEKVLGIVARHHTGAAAFDTSTALTATVDDALLAAYSAVMDPGGPRIAVFALGGYGRRELFPGSDVDVMVLCEEADDRREIEETVRKFLHILWDAGLNIGHSVRTIPEALAAGGRTLDVWVSQLEARFVCGDRALAGGFAESMASRLPEIRRWLIEGLLADQRARHERYGTSVKLLEPNVKKSAGGLRDAHTLLWLYRGADPAFPPAEPGPGPAHAGFLRALSEREGLDEREYLAAVEALEFLFRVRHEMHLQRDGQHDTLEYALQMAVAEGLRFSPEPGLRPVEVFMREYYRHARIIHKLNRRLTQRFRETLDAAGGHAPGETLQGGFRAEEDRLCFVPGVEGFANAVHLFDALVLAAERNLVPDARLRAAIERGADLLGPDAPASPDLASRFRRILRSRSVGPVLREMNDADVLGRYIPEFGRLVAFFQHNVYHYFTADEHTLIAVENAERLREQPGYLREIFRRVERKDLLYLAILLHDIAKPDGVADHEITGGAIARIVLGRLGLHDLADDVEFLIRYHLVMEQVAFRRNIHDAATIREFTARFPRPALLDHLYLLTYADLSAVNPNVWTRWKASILQELHQFSSEVLHRNLQGSQIDAYHTAKHEEAAEQVVSALSNTMPREEVERHLAGIDSPSYIASFTDREIGDHLQKIAAREPVSTLFSHAGGYTEVTVIGHDAPFALSRFCAVLSANDANIFDANIFTRDDGIIIDRFRVTDAANRQQLEYRVCQKIAEDLRKVTAGETDITHLLAAHHRKWKRRPRHPHNPSTRLGVEFEDGERYTIIDVYATDSVGFLYRVTETISRLGLDIYFAKIATRVDGIVDAFYVRERGGGPLTDGDRRDAVREEVLRTIHSIEEQQLA
jgi:[protein-PII] uridylyltransferase